MIKKSRNLILVALALAAFAGPGSAPAQAEQAAFTAGAYPATVTGTQVGENVFGFGGLWEVTCPGASSTGTLLSKGGIQMTASYGECVANESFPVTVRTNGCVYAWKLETLEGPGTAAGWTSGSCGGGKMVEFDLYEGSAAHKFGFAFCTYGIPAQIETSIQTHNAESGGVEDVQLTLNLTGFNVKVLKGSSLLCGAEAGQTVSGSYTGTQTLSATDEEGKATSFMVGS
ncbi:MAG TPA: hypothetical protein VFT79_13840 [Solirubrobacterales bacterium]|nr:hypothetical protein [Solirubrobacterales bacterium]